MKTMNKTKPRIVQTIPVSSEYWLEFKSIVRSRRAAWQPATRDPERLDLARTMKPNLFDRLLWKEGKIVASFGAAKLIRHRDGRWELHGGSPGDHAAAREWCSLFQHEANLPAEPVPLTIQQDTDVHEMAGEAETFLAKPAE